FFETIEAVADAKAEIFAGLEPDGIAVLNRDNRWFDRLAAAAQAAGAGRIVSFGAEAGATVRLTDFESGEDGSVVSVGCDGRPDLPCCTAPIPGSTAWPPPRRRRVRAGSSRSVPRRGRRSG